MPSRREPTIGIVLSGGGARGFAHVGVLRVLEEAGARFDVVAGTSMGAIVGAMYAAGLTPDEILSIISETTWRDVVDLSLGTGLMKGERVHALLSNYLPADFDDLVLPLAVISTDIESGEEVVHYDGALVTAVRASASFPGAFEPVFLDGRALVDGGLVNNLPTSAAFMLGATRVIASDVTPPRQSIYAGHEAQTSWWERMVATVKLERRTPMVQMLFRSTDIMQSMIVDIREGIHPADLRIQIKMPQYRIESFANWEEIVAEGELVARHALADAGGLESVLALTGAEPVPVAALAGSDPASDAPRPESPRPDAPVPDAQGPEALDDSTRSGGQRRGIIGKIAEAIKKPS